MKTQAVKPIKFQLQKETIKHIEKSTGCSIEELKTLSFNETKELMIKRGAIKKPNVIKNWFADKYKQFGERLGLLKKEYNFYTHVD